MGAEIANSGKSIHLYAIDHWLGSDEDGHRADEDLSRGGLYQVFLENIRPVANWVTPIRSDSAAAAALFPDESVDFLYIDAEHTYAGVCRDIKAWCLS